MADPVNITTLIPRVRRALEGPAGTVTLTDVQLRDATADASAQIVLYTGSLFGKTLTVSAVDDATGIPDAYEISEPLSLAEQEVVAAQAALNYFFYKFAGVKTSEKIGDEGESWEYALSAQLLRDQLRILQEERDRALAAIESTEQMDSYISFLAVRDARTAALIEPWAGSGALVGMETDVRFGGW